MNHYFDWQHRVLFETQQGAVQQQLHLYGDLNNKAAKQRSTTSNQTTTKVFMTWSDLITSPCCKHCKRRRIQEFVNATWILMMHLFYSPVIHTWQITHRFIHADREIHSLLFLQRMSSLCTVRCWRSIQNNIANLSLTELLCRFVDAAYWYFLFP